MIEVSNADRVVFPVVQRTKGDVVAYYARIAPRALGHVLDRPLSIKRYPKGLAGPGFFQKNVPAHYPESIARFAVPRSKAATKKHPRARAGPRTGTPTKSTEPAEFTVYPVLSVPEHLAYVANQGAIELHVPTAHASDLRHPDRIVIDLDPPSGAVALVRRAAHIIREALARGGLESAPMATGSKGYHVIASIRPTLDVDTLAVTLQKFAALLAAQHPDELTTAFRIALRGERVFLDWLRNTMSASVVAPYSLRARPNANVATPLAWSELDTIAPDAFTIDDVDRLLDRPDSIAELTKTPGNAESFVAAIDADFEASGLVLETFDRFRS